MARWLLILLLLTLLGAAGVGAWQWQQDNLLAPFSFENTFIAPLIDEVFKTGEILTPEPLKGPINAVGKDLTIAGILASTNQQRALNDLTPLRANPTLDQAAQTKVADMFARQYFAHEAPDGTGPADLVRGVHYEFIRVGENLALGNFASDADLVQAWMDSPGHRANILHTGFSEIGLAVREGDFEGSRVWLAVQTFAAPLSSCPNVDPKLQKEFDQLKKILDQLSIQLPNEQSALTAQQEEFESQGAEIQALAEAGNAKVTAGNEEIERGNQIYQETGDRDQAQPHWDNGAALQAEGQALLEQAQAKQTELTEQASAYEAKRHAFNKKVESQRQQSETINTLQSSLNQQIRAFNDCIK